MIMKRTLNFKSSYHNRVLNVIRIWLINSDTVEVNEPQVGSSKLHFYSFLNII